MPTCYDEYCVKQISLFKTLHQVLLLEQALMPMNYARLIHG